MRAVFGLVLVIGLGLAGFAVYMVQGYLSQQDSALARERARAAEIVATTKIYAPTRQITYGELILEEDLALIDYAVEFVPEGAFATLEEVFPEGTDVPRVALRQMEPLEPLMAVKVTEAGGDAGITSRLDRGMRAFTIKVDVASGVSGFLRPTDRVDVYWTGTAGNQTRSFTQLIKSGVEIIAIDQTSDADRSCAAIARTVTVQVSSQDVGALAQAQSSGALSLSLLGDNDDAVAGDVLVDQQSLLGLPDEPVVAAAAPVEAKKICTIKTRRGAEVLEIPIPCTN